jgi:hypothetical protein
MRRVTMLVMVALLAACGTDGESGSSDNGGEPAEESSTTTEEQERDLEADQEIADGAVLTIDDVPDGFAEEPEDDEDSDDAEFDQSFADCLGITVAELNDDDDEPQASTTFETAAGAEVSSDVIMHATEDEVTEDLDMVKDPATQDCFADALNETFAADGEVEIGDITIEELAVEDLGEDAFGFGVGIPFAAESGERVLYLDLVLIQQGRAGVSMGFTSFDAPFDAELGFELAATVVDRVPADA